MGRALRPSTPGDFPVAGKVTKGAPRAVPFGIPRCVVAALFALAALRSVSRRATFYYKPRPICHFKLVGKSVFFLPKLHRGSHPLLSIRGAAGMPRGCRRFYTPATNTARAEGGGIQGGPPPCTGGQEFSELQTRRFLAYLSQHLCCYFPLREKVGRGAEHGNAMLSRSARGWVLGATSPAKAY